MPQSTNSRRVYLRLLLFTLAGCALWARGKDNGSGSGAGGSTDQSSGTTDFGGQTSDGGAAPAPGGEGGSSAGDGGSADGNNSNDGGQPGTQPDPPAAGPGSESHAGDGSADNQASNASPVDVNAAHDSAVQAEAAGSWGTVWLRRTLPDPTPPAKRLDPRFA